MLETNNITFTGFLSNDEYERLIENCSGIISGTKEKYTALMSAWEAVAYSKPLATTDSQALRESHGEYPAYYDWKDTVSIGQVIEHLMHTELNPQHIVHLKSNAINSVESLKLLMNHSI